MNKRYSIVVSVILVILVILFYCKYINNKKIIEVEATIVSVGDSYIIAVDDDGVEYILRVDGEYNVGDRVDFLIKRIKDGSNPVDGDVVEINIISKDINFSIVDDGENNGNVNDSSVNNNTTNNSEQVATVVATDEDVVSYFTSLNKKFDTYSQDKNIGDELKKDFVMIIDFLFYGGKIKGKTFEELSTSAKLKVLEVALSIDLKIEQYFPGYKETLSSNGKKIYTGIKTKVVELYLDITTKICKNDPGLCEEAKKGLKDLKEQFSITWDIIKDASDIGLEKLKEWYKVWKEA